MCYACYSEDVETISHRELRNNSGQVLARVKDGERFVVTNDGEPVAIVSRIADERPRAHRPARVVGPWEPLPKWRLGTASSTQELLDDLRGER